MTEAANAALYEIAEAQGWTEWGYGHGTSMYSGACERRGYIEVAEPDKPSRGRFLYRATRAGIVLANTWRKERGEELLSVPSVGKPWPENLDTWELHDEILNERNGDRLRALNEELRRRLDAE